MAGAAGGWGCLRCPLRCCWLGCGSFWAGCSGNTSTGPVSIRENPAATAHHPQMAQKLVRALPTPSGGYAPPAKAKMNACMVDSQVKMSHHERSQLTR